jgi:hypothetical protein
MPRTANINVRVEPELKAAVEKAAAADHRSVASLLEKLLTEHLQQTGFLPGLAANVPKRNIKRAS